MWYQLRPMSGAVLPAIDIISDDFPPDGRLIPDHWRTSTSGLYRMWRIRTFVVALSGEFGE